MKRCYFILLPACFGLLAAGGCATNEALVVNSPPAATVKAGQPAAEPAPAVAPGKVVNAIAAIVNDEIITLLEVNREAQQLIRENEKKSALDDAARSRIRRTALDSLVEKKLVEQKIKEL